MGETWIAVDWGTTRLRAWHMQGRSMRNSAESGLGMASLGRAGFEPALQTLIAPWRTAEQPMTILACGMVGARQGWIEAPYRAVPTHPVADAVLRAPTQDPALSVWIVPGLKQANPADVMRGEETQIAGFLTQNPGFDGVLCLPGTHTKWAQISAGEVVSFRTFMTGELFSVLQNETVLRHSLDAEGWDEDAFSAAVTEGLSDPQKLGAALFGLRADQLLNDRPAATTRARLSGLLIGLELAGARPYWLGQAVAIIGAEGLAKIYAQALALQGLTPVLADVGEMTRTGLAQARVLLLETIQ